MTRWAGRLRALDRRFLAAAFPTTDATRAVRAPKESRQPLSPVRWLPEDSEWRREPLKSVLEIGFPVPVVLVTLFVISGGWTSRAIALRLAVVVGGLALLLAALLCRRQRGRGE